MSILAYKNLTELMRIWQDKLAIKTDHST